MQTLNVPTLERAFQLARTGRCRTTDEVFRTLKKEGHDPRLLIGPYLMRQLRAVMHDAARLRRGS
jgi:hypothetical protein